MIVLGLDTTGPDCSVSIVDDAIVRAHISKNIGRGHAEVLAGMVADVFAAAELTPNDVDRLAVCTGPGSFTITADEAAQRSAEMLSVETFATDTRILAWLAIDRDPEDYPAEPLYSRGPDAKLPGGKSLAK